MTSITAADVRCPACFGQGEIIFRAYPGYQEPDTFDIASCSRCHTSFVIADNINVTPIYEAIYRQVEDVPGYGRYLCYAQEVIGKEDPLTLLANAEVVYWGIKQHLSTRFPRREGRILEIGSGLGYLTYALNRAGYDATGIDLSSAAVERARQLYGSSKYICADLLDYAQSHAGQYDLVITTEVIEHLSDIYPFLQAALTLLRPGGEMLLTTPNRNCYEPNVVWEVEGPPVHLLWLTPESFQHIAARLNCRLELVDLSDFPHAGEWHLEQVPGSPCVSKRPVLNRRGELIYMVSSPGGRIKHSIRTTLRRFGLWRRLHHNPPLLTQTNSNASLPLKEKHSQGPCPTLCVLLQTQQPDTLRHEETSQA